MPYFFKQTQVPAPVEEVFAWHEQPQVLSLLIPPWENVKILNCTGPISLEGSRVTLRINILGPIAIDWVSEHHNYQAGFQFQDSQIKGPFHYWKHTHRFIPVDDMRCLIEDEIEYALPLAPLSHWIAGWVVKRKLSLMFDYRHEQVLKAFSKI